MLMPGVQSADNIRETLKKLDSQDPVQLDKLVVPAFKYTASSGPDIEGFKNKGTIFEMVFGPQERQKFGIN